MNRRRFALIALVIAVGLYAGPLVSPVPDYGPHLRVTVQEDPMTFQTEEAKETQLRNTTTMRYRNLSGHAQRLFDRGYKQERYSDEPTVRLDEAPESWTTLIPKERYDSVSVYVHKDGQYYYMGLSRFTPGPSFGAFMLRLGPLLGAVGLGTLAGFFVLTAED